MNIFHKCKFARL